MTTMSPSSAAPHLPHTVLEQAADWYAVLRDGKAGPHDRENWQAWLLADEAHRMAWRQVEHISRSFEPLHGQPEARLAADTLDIAARRLSRRRIVALTGVITTGGLLGLLTWRESALSAHVMALGADLHTDTGEQREILLEDGTRLWLNTGSAVNISFDSKARTIELVRGEAFIDTARDAYRPFLVRTQQGFLQALGTRFNVRRDVGQTSLAVYEGAVKVRSAASGAIRVVPAGEQARFDARGIDANTAADPARQAWTAGTLMAENITLGEVVEELRRYSPGHIGVADEVAQLKVFGNFPIDDIDRVLGMLATALPIRIERPMPWWTHIEARH